MKAKVISLILILSFSILLFSYNLQYWPSTWFDEGIFLQVSKNLALSNRYGIESSEGFRYYDPIITTGPTVIYPIALVFKLFGTDLIWGRLVIVLFSTLTVLVFFLIADSLFGLNAAIIASLFLLTSTAVLEDISGSFMGLSRMVMGEVPAVFFMLFGSALWFRAIDKNRFLLLLGSGVLFGLAALTKTQHVLTLAVFFMIYIVDRIWYKKLRLSDVIIPLIVSILCLILWNLYQIYALEPGLIDTASVSQRVGSYVTIFSLQTVIRSARVLLSSGVLIWGLPGLIYGLYLCSERSTIALKRCFLLCIILIFLGWFLLGSIGWIRYAFPAIVLLNIFTAKLLVELADDFAFLIWFRRKNRMEGHTINKFVKGVAVAVAILMMILIPLQIWFVDIARSLDTSAFDFANYLDENVSSDAIIESSETEIVFLSDRKFHQPTVDVAVATIQNVQFAEPYPPGFYDLRPVNPDYIILGPYAKWTQLYTQYLNNHDYDLVNTVGGYELLKRKNTDGS